ncbi:MAG: alpha/beta hydrolase [Acidimicrobiales bacterium]
MSHQLHHITVPTLVCAGEFDDLAPIKISEALAAGIPNAKLRVFQGGHLFMLQDRTAMKEIIEFLDG